MPMPLMLCRHLPAAGSRRVQTLMPQVRGASDGMNIIWANIMVLSRHVLKQAQGWPSPSGLWTTLVRKGVQPLGHGVCSDAAMSTRAAP